MNEPLLSEAEAIARANELLAQFASDPDVLSPDEQALVMAFRRLERIMFQVLDRHASAITHTDRECDSAGIVYLTRADHRRADILALLTRELSPWKFSGQEPMCIELFHLIESYDMTAKPVEVPFTAPLKKVHSEP